MRRIQLEVVPMGGFERAARRCNAVFAAILAATVVVPAASQDGSAVRGLYAANALLNDGHFDFAAREYRAFLESHAGHERADEARYGLGVCLYRLNHYDEAVTELAPLRTARDFPFAAEARLVLGQSLLELDRPDDAAAVFAELLRADPGHAQAQQAAALLAESYLRAGRGRQCAEAAAAYVERYPAGPLRERVELVWGLAETAQGDDAAAAARFERLLARFADGELTDQALLLCGRALHRSGQPARAEATYRAVLSRGAVAQRPDALYGLALLLHEQERLEEAAAAADELLAEKSAGPELLASAGLLRGNVWFDQGSFDRALWQFEALQAGPEPHRDDAAWWAARCLLRRDRPGDAAERLEAAIREFPGSELQPRMRYDLAVALVRAGRPDEALAALRELERAQPGHALAPQALHLEAATVHQQGRYEESLALCRRFLEKDPGHELAPDAAWLAAENEFLLDHDERAAAAFEAFLDAHPGHAQAVQARFRLGLALYRLGRHEEAEDLLVPFTRGARIDPRYRAALLALGDGYFQRGQWAEAQRRLEEYLSLGLDQPSADDALLKLGLSLERRDRHEEAAMRFEQLAGAFPQSPHRAHALFEHGQALAALGRQEEAKAAFERLLADDDAGRFAPYAIRHLGALAQAFGEYEEAARYFGDAAGSGRGVAPQEWVGEAVFLQGQALMSAQEFAGAAEVLRGLLAAQPGHARRPEASALLAIATARVAEPAAALGRIDQVEAELGDRLDGELHASLMYEKAWCLRALGRSQEAADAYGAALKRRPAWSLRLRCMLELSELEVESRQFEEASARLRDLQALLDGSEGAPAEVVEHCRYQLGVCALELGDHRAAADRFEELLRDSPRCALAPSARLLAGEAYFTLGSPGEAAAHLEALVGDFGDDESCDRGLLLLGACHAATGTWPRSEGAYRDWLDRFDDPARRYEALFGLGFALEHEGRFDEAVEAYRRVSQEHHGPHGARAQFQLGECMFAQKRFEDAISAYLLVGLLFKYPEWSAAAHYEAGECFRELGDRVRAAEQYRKAQEALPGGEWAGLAAARLSEMERTGLPGRP